MNPMLLLLLIPPLLVAAFCRWKWHETITWVEAAAQAIVPMVLIAIVWGISTYAATQDFETLNGQVTGKAREWTSCSHSYSCRCRTVRTGKNSSTRVCDTCYWHSNDWDYRVKTTVGDFFVERVDWQGVRTPQRWSIVENGQPVAKPHGYTNYVKGAPDSLFHPILDFKGKLPEYPGYYDYQFSDRVIGAPRDGTIWNDQLAHNLRKLGAEKQVNYLIVITKSAPRFADALKSKWIGGKKNDVVVVVGSKNYPTIDWVRVFSWSKNEIANVSIRNAVLESGRLDPVRTNNLIADGIRRDYVRRPMADFDYLKDDVHPSTWVMVLALILGLAASIGLAIYFHGNEYHAKNHYRPADSRRRWSSSGLDDHRGNRWR